MQFPLTLYASIRSLSALLALGERVLGLRYDALRIERGVLSILPVLMAFNPV